MRNNISEQRSQRLSRRVWSTIRASLTPQEQKAILFTAGLFALGAIVRWFRLTHIR